MFRLLLLLTLLLPAPCYSQFNYSLDSLRILYPDKTQHVLENSIVLNYEVQGTKLKIFEERRILLIWLSAGEPELTVERQVYNPNQASFKSYKITEFEKQYKGFKKTSGIFSDLDISGTSAFFDDLRMRIYSYRQLSPGAFTLIEYIKEIPSADFTPSYDLEVTKAKSFLDFKIKTSADIVVDWFISGDSSNLLHSVSSGPSITENSWHNVYSATDEKCPAVSELYPILKSWKNKKETVLAGTVETYRTLCNTYISHVDFNKDIPQAALILDSLSNNSKDSLQLARNIYYWVSESVKYIAIVSGNRSLAPLQAEQVLTNRFGDCKDKSVLLCYLLKKAGFAAQLAIVGTRDIPFQISEVPTLSSCNHMVVVLKINDRNFILDATDPAIEFATPSAFIQGKEVLVLGNTTEVELIKIPVPEADLNIREYKLTLNLSNGSLSGLLIIKASGYDKEILKEEIVSDPGSFLFALLPDFKLEQMVQNNPANRDSAYEIIAIIKSDTKLNQDILFNKGLFLGSINAAITEKTNCGLSYYCQRQVNAMITIRFDSSFNCKGLKPKYEIENDLISIRCMDKLTANEYEHCFTFYNKVLWVDKSKHPSLKQDMSNIHAYYQNLIELEYRK